jgi:hypothetical protein
MAKCDTFTEIPLTEKTQTDGADTPRTLRDRCNSLLYWVRYWWTWWGAMCCR